MTVLNRAALEADLAANVFAPSPAASRTPGRVGAEVELIPVENATGRRCPIEGDGCCATLPFLRRHGARQGWIEARTSKGTPCFALPGGGSLTFEPGGQLEYSSPVCGSPSALLALLRRVVLPLRASAASEGIALLTVGIDPANGIEGAPLLLRTRRYARMAEYLARRGPAGALMMRQTAAFQVALDMDERPWLRWRVLNAMAPYLVAIFANSSTYAGQAAGTSSARAQVWRALDPLRTGLPYDASTPIAGYLDFALAAPAILFPTVHGEYLGFGEWLGLAAVTLDEWRDHLSTLFPEVRPRSHFELRSPDAVPPEWYAAPLALAVGAVYDPRSLSAAADLLGTPDVGLLDRASSHGLRDPMLASTAADLAQLALEGCARLGPAYFAPSDLEQARTFFDQYTRRARCLADDLRPARVAAA